MRDDMRDDMREHFRDAYSELVFPVGLFQNNILSAISCWLSLQGNIQLALIIICA